MPLDTPSYVPTPLEIILISSAVHIVRHGPANLRAFTSHWIAAEQCGCAWCGKGFGISQGTTEHICFLLAPSACIDRVPSPCHLHLQEPLYLRTVLAAVVAGNVGGTLLACAAVSRWAEQAHLDTGWIQ